MSNDIATIPLNDLTIMAKTMAESGLFGVKNATQALALMLLAQAEGIHPALAARDYSIINNRPAKTAEAMLRDFIKSGGRVEWHELSDTLAAATFTHPQGGSRRIDWDTARAKQAGLASKEMYAKYPRQMLRSRTVSEGVRTIFPAATSGMYVPEEVRDMPVTDTENIPIIESLTDTTAELDQFAAVTGEPEPPPERDILAEARSASLRGVEAFRDFWVALSQTERKSIRSHLAEFEAAAKRADDPFDLPPLDNDLLNRPETAS